MMWFLPYIVAPILAGLIAGVWTARRSVPLALSGICVGLGVVGAIVSAFNSDGRTDNISFSLVAGLVCGALAWGGYGVGRVTRWSAPRSA
jgi:hypothetical protein